MNAAALTHDLDYHYDPSKGHQLDHIWDPASGTTTSFKYNTSGSITQIDDPAQAIPQDFFWNEQQQLTGVKNQQGVHHYIYDHQGERLMKSSLINTSVYLNDQVIDNVTNLDPYTVYVNPFYVVTGLLGGDRVSKHYYMNQQRVATDITINYDPNGGGGGEYAPSKGLDDLKEVVQELSHEPLDTSVLTLPSLTDYYPETATAKSSNSQAEGAGSSGRILFWYHPDYLGNVDLVTEIDGFAHEFFIYNPWGEEMHQWNANIYAFTSPYRFNAKELDPETGLAYYGARYYQNKMGVWLSVDPLANKRESFSPYNFVQNNPSTRIDPTGALDTKYEDEAGNLLAVTNDGNDATVTISDKNKDAFMKEYNKQKLNGIDGSVMYNEGWIRRFGQSMDAMVGENVPKWSIGAINSSQTAQEYKASGAATTAAGAVLSVGSFTMHNKEGWFSLKQMKGYSHQFHGNGYTGGRLAHGRNFSKGLSAIGNALGVYNALSIEEQYSSGQISGVQRWTEQGSNVISTVGGIYGAAWGVGWEAGRAITNIPGYHENVRVPVQRFLGIRP